MGFRRGRGLLHPAYFRHAVPTLEGDFIATIEIARPGSNEQLWVIDPEEEYGGRWEYVGNGVYWSGNARVQPNVDWRARTRTWAGEQTAEHAVNVQFNMAKNTLVPRSEWPAPMVDVQYGDIVRVITNPNDPAITEYPFVVRNAINPADSWLRSILCDVHAAGELGGVPDGS